MQKFSEYVNDSKQENTQTTKNNKSNNANMNESAFELLKRVAAQYEGASQEDLIVAILKEAKLAKERGTLSANEIQNFVSTVSPMLSSSQRKQLDGIIEKILND
ncbi:MAG: hypothetical protein IKJ19_04325 [Clostridia bacterium]|nr:hypothetical protein [Clostridia bacterium]